jgi:hypothetical protein
MKPLPAGICSQILAAKQEQAALPAVRRQAQSQIAKIAP